MKLERTIIKLLDLLIQKLACATATVSDSYQTSNFDDFPLRKGHYFVKTTERCQSNIFLMSVI